MLLLLLFVLLFGVVFCDDCAFIPGPISELDYTGVMKVDCDKQPAADAGLAANTGDFSDTRDLLVYLYNCPTVPGRMFVNVTASLSAVTLVSEDSQQMLEGTFEGLENIVELRVEGFQSLRTLSRLTFRPLRSLQRLFLIQFGAHTLTYAELGEALFQLSGTPLRRIVMHEIHSHVNEQTVNINELFHMRNMTVRELVFSNNLITRISGRISTALPDVNYLCIGTNARYNRGVNALFDVLFFAPNLQEMVGYSYPMPDQVSALPAVPTGEGINLLHLDPAISVALLKHMMHDNCYFGLWFPLTPSLRRLTVRNLQLLDAEVHQPVCFHVRNNIEHFDLAGSPLPSNMTLLTGLDKLKYLSLQNTGILYLPDNFLAYFPELEVINLVQLSIGPWLKHINNSFFGSCQTLREIHLGDCQLTTIPPSVFLLLSSLETLNLSSNSLHTFDLNLSNNSNITHLNLSGNAILTLSEDTLAQLKAIAKYKQQTGDRLTLDLRMNPLRCMCNSTQFVRKLQDWVRKQEVNVPGFEEYICLYTNGSEVAMSQVDVDQLVTQCSVLSEIKNGSNCPCDDDLRHRLELVRLSLDVYFCRNSDGSVVSMTDQRLSGCLNVFKTATFIVPVVVGGVLTLLLLITSIASIVLYRHRKSKRVIRVMERLSINRIVRLGIQHLMSHSQQDSNTFSRDVFLYIHHDDLEAAEDLFAKHMVPSRHVVRQDDFHVGTKLDWWLENIRTCRWLVPVLSQNFVDNGECSHFIARAQYSRPHAIVPVVWTPFHTDDLTINTLLDTAEPVTWPGDKAPNVDKTVFWNNLVYRTSNDDDKMLNAD